MLNGDAFEPFDSDDYIFELKIDGFRALAYNENGQCDLVSRNGNKFRNFKDLAQWIGENLRVDNVVVDGEIACVDDSGRSVSNDLLFRRGSRLEPFGVRFGYKSNDAAHLHQRRHRKFPDLDSRQQAPCISDPVE